MNLFSLLFGFKGRINRLQYWLGTIGAGLGGVVLSFAFGSILAPTAIDPKGATAAGPLAALIFAVLMLAMSWCGFALQVKRFHDRGRSGYWALAPLVPVTMMMMAILNGIATNAPAQQVVPELLPWFGILMLMNLWLFIDLGLLSGTPGPNKYDYTPGGGGAGSGGGSAASVFSPSKASASAASIFGGAEQAIDRAVAEQARAAATRAAASAAAAAAAPVRVTAPSGAPAFGRKQTR